MILPDKPTPAQTEEETKAKNPFATHEIYIKEEQVQEFENLLDRRAGEKSIDEFLTKNPAVFSAALHNYRRGHHGVIVIPKQSIRPHIKTDGVKGLIPDFIIGGDSSDGWSWWVVEIKGSDQPIFAQTGNDTYFNTEINKGICQLLEYIDFCSEQQAMLREVFKLENFREPRGLLIAGMAEELEKDVQKQKLKAAWNRISGEKLEIRTFDFIRRVLRPIFKVHNKN